jgi:hypothetical protein
MKRELSLYFLLTLMITTLSYHQFVSRKQPGTKTLSINLQNDQMLEIAIQAKVFITEGDGQSVVVEGTEKSLKSIKITEDMHKLSITYSGMRSLMGMKFQGNPDNVQIYINLKDMDLLSFKTKSEIISSDYILKAQEAQESLAQKETIASIESASDIVFFDFTQIVSKVTEKAFHDVIQWLLPLQLKSFNDPAKKSACCCWV